MLLTMMTLHLRRICPYMMKTELDIKIHRSSSVRRLKRKLNSLRKSTIPIMGKF